jgi:hypothetical protein
VRKKSPNPSTHLRTLLKPPAVTLLPHPPFNRITVDYVGRGWTRDPTVGEGDVAFQLTEGAYISTVAVRACGNMIGFDLVRMMVKMTQTLGLGKGFQSLLRGYGTIDMDDGDSRDGLGFTIKCWEADGTGVTILTQAGLGRDVVRAISDMSKEEKESFLKLYGGFGALLEVFCLNSGESRGTQPRRAGLGLGLFNVKLFS